VSGSIVLASIVLKLALYGFIRILIGIYLIGTCRLNPIFLGFCAMSLLYSSLTTIRQFDLKVLVAYSSVAHMASTLLGTFSNTLYGIIGSIIFGLAHGFVSPGLFIIVGAVLYDRCGSRVINYYKGLNNYLPFLALIFLILVFGNMGVPLTGNFVGEFLSLLGAYQQNIFIATLGALSVILSAIYSMYMYNRVTSGTISPYIHTIPDIFRKEYYLLLPLLVLTIVLGVYPSFITSDIEFVLSNYLLMLPIIGRSDNSNEFTQGNVGAEGSSNGNNDKNENSNNNNSTDNNQSEQSYDNNQSPQLDNNNESPQLDNNNEFSEPDNYNQLRGGSDNDNNQPEGPDNDNNQPEGSDNNQPEGSNDDNNQPGGSNDDNNQPGGSNDGNNQPGGSDNNEPEGSDNNNQSGGSDNGNESEGSNGSD
jgi:hypothetical protein